MALEFKVPGQKATPLQIHEMAKIGAAGGIATTVESVEQVAAVLTLLRAIPALTAISPAQAGGSYV